MNSGASVVWVGFILYHSYITLKCLRKGDGLMPKLPTSPMELEEMGIDVVHRRFDGIKFLWQTPETHYLLKLILVLLGFMIIYTILITILIAIFGLTLLLSGFCFLLQPFFLLCFLFILVELAQFYWNDRKYKRFPERNSLLKMKYWHSRASKGYKRYFLSIIIILNVILLGVFLFINVFHIPRLGVFYSMYLGLIDNSLFFDVIFVSFIHIPSGIYFLMGFITTRGIMKLFEKRYVEKFQQQWHWFFILFPIPWIFLIGISVWLKELYDLSHILGGEFGSSGVSAALYSYMFLSILGLLVIPKRNWRAGYTASQIATSYIFLLVVIIPMFLGSIIDLMGHFASYIAIVFLFIQGNLDGYGDDLRKYYDAWERKLQKFHIFSEEDSRNQTYDRALFDNTPLDTDVPNAYRNFILGLALLLLTLFGFIFHISLTFPLLGTEVGIELLKTQLELLSLPEISGIALAIFLYVILIVFRKRTFAAVTP